MDETAVQAWLDAGPGPERWLLVLPWRRGVLPWALRTSGASVPPVVVKWARRTAWPDRIRSLRRGRVDGAGPPRSVSESPSTYRSPDDRDVSPRLSTLLDDNLLAVKRRNSFRADVRAGGDATAYQVLKHEFPYRGFVPATAEGHDVLLFSNNDDVVAWEYFWKGEDSYERPLITQWLKWCVGARRILDIGAYTGLMSLLAARVNPTADIHAMEPVPRTVERLWINVAANAMTSQISVHPVAASNRSGTDSINLYRPENFLGTGNSVHDKGLKTYGTLRIELVETSDYLKTVGAFDLVKVDVEGYEPQVLEGLQDVLQRDRPKLLLEVWEENEEKVLSMLNGWSYDFDSPDSASRRVRNYLCTPRG